MKSLNDYLTPLARSRWLEIKSNPQHDGFTTKQILSNILARTPATFLLDLSAGQVHPSITPNPPNPSTKPPLKTSDKYDPVAAALFAAMTPAEKHAQILSEFGDD